MSKIFLSKEGYINYLQDIENLKMKIDDNAKMKSIYANDDAYGDGWHDNFAYEQTLYKEYELFNLYQQKIKNLDNIVIVDSLEEGIVGIDKYVKLIFLDDNSVFTYYISGNIRGDISDNVISINSPLGQALYKKKVGDIVSYEVNNTDFFVKIIDINSHK